MSMPGQNKSAKPKLLKNSPFQRLAERTVETGDEALKEARQISLAHIDPNPRQPRRDFDPDRLKELADDILARGILQPPIVRTIPGSDRYEIVVGERRYRAAKQAGLSAIPVIVRDDLDDEAVEITSLIENIQREDLSVSEEASFYKMLQTKYGYSIRDLAEQVAHKSHGYVDTRLKLAENPGLLQAVQEGKIGLQKANLLVRLEPAEMQAQLKASLRESQTVFSKDTKLQTSQEEPKDELEKIAAAKLSAQISRPFLNFARDIKVVARRLDRLEKEEKKALLENLEQLEQEIAGLKHQLKRD